MTSPPQTKQNYVYLSLRDEIQSGRIEPGARLAIADLETMFGVSHIPIREAMRTLAREGFLDLVPHAPARVRSLSVDEALWVIELRLLLEPLAVSGALETHTPATLEALDDLYEAMRRAVDAGDLKAYYPLDYRFHRQLFETTPNRHLARIVDELAEIHNRYNNVSGKAGIPAVWQEEHRRLIEAVGSGDHEEAEATMRRHLAQIREMLEAERRAIEDGETGSSRG